MYSNLKSFTKENAKEMGRRGGIASGITRRKKAKKNKFYKKYFEIYNVVNKLENEEYFDLINDFSKEDKEQIELLFKPTNKQIKLLLKNNKYLLK